MSGIPEVGVWGLYVPPWMHGILRIQEFSRLA
jgi:hypothetical protein